jgi:dipeptidyl aminopeptidase/acylaminoacyl peptidase
VIQKAPYGSWRSPITSELIVSEAVRLGFVAVDGSDVYWLEGRPTEGGRQVLVRRTQDGAMHDAVPAPFNVRTRVHEYGGASYVVDAGTVWFTNFVDQRLYRLDAAGEPRPITPEGDRRCADMVVDLTRGRLVCVEEDHNSPGEAVNRIVGVALEDGARSVLVEGSDFYAAPRLHPAGSGMCWLSWNHPNMPWDGTELWVADIMPDGSLGDGRLVAGGVRESVAQPVWSPDGTLYFVSDRSGWWNLYRYRDGSDRAENLTPIEAEFAMPAWLLGWQSYGFVDAGHIVCAAVHRGESRLAVLDTATGQLDDVATPFSEMGTSLVVRDGVVIMDAGSPSQPLSIVAVGLGSRYIEVYRRSVEISVDPGYLSQPRAIEFPTEGGRTAHGFYYPPSNGDYAAPPEERPPLLVKSHGGPTSATTNVLDLGIQYWTSRGIAVLDVNYGGSTGFGRSYRERLDGRWGIVDLDDCVNGARHLVELGQVDPRRLLIDGGSAGGYTTLCALTFRDLFAAGASYYGVGDLEALAHDTHKFESRYLDGLVAPYPERRDIWAERSPINHVEQLNCPVILFQGLEDKIVPPNQAETMFAALRIKGIPCAYVAFEGEQHGFRRAESIRRALDGELYFYSRVFGFELADPVEPVPIENLPAT